MRFKSLEYYKVLIECGSFTQAAENLFISQQGLSKAISDLEKRLGVPLLAREGREISPTEEGELLLAFADDVLGKYAEFQSSLNWAKASKPPTGSFAGMHLAATAYTCIGLINRVGLDATERGLDECVLTELVLNDIIRLLSQDEVDLALVNFLDSDLERILANERIRFFPLFSADIVLLSTKALTPFETGKIDARRIVELPLAYYNDPVLNSYVDSVVADAGARASNLIQHTSNLERMYALLESGKAVTFSDTFVATVRKHKDHVFALDLEPKRTFFVGFLARADLEESSPARDYVRRFTSMMRASHGSYMKKHPVPIP